MPLSAGSRLGPYEIESAVGAGGMGEVYRARDTRLDRAVAIKTLPEELSHDPERRARFQLEARAIAALTHPHICALHDVGHQDGVDYLVMELLDGETLADRISRGPLPVSQALTYGVQIADGLAKAHGHGFVHRDLKPANVMLTRSGAKLLDFGLAKLRVDGAPKAVAVTKTGPVTSEGQILGTLNYMSPEQLNGKPVDARSDIFAFGLIVFEMITGKRAFDGPSQASVIGQILHTDPPSVPEVVPGAAPALARLVKHVPGEGSRGSMVERARCAVAVEGHGRWRGARAPGRSQAPQVARMAGVVRCGHCNRRCYRARHRSPRQIADPARRRSALDVLSVLPPAGTIQPFGDAPQISPDGRHVAFVATDQAGKTWLYVRSLDSETARALPDTGDAAQPFWAPDSQRLGFFAEGQLKIVPLAGGSPRVLAGASVPRGGTWNRDDVILFAPIPGGSLRRIPAGGGEPIDVPVAAGARPWNLARLFPTFLPDGRHYLYLGRRGPDSGFVVRVASIDSTETKDLVESTAVGLYAPPGYLLFRREGSLVAQPFDPTTRELSGAAVPIAEHVGFNALTFQGLFSVSATGRLAYQASTVGSELVWFDRKGNRLRTEGSEREYNTVCLTADEKRIVYELATSRSGDVDIWSQELSDGPATRLTFDPATDFYPVCSRVGSEIVFASLREGRPNLFRVSLEAPGNDRPLLKSPMPKIPYDWSSDGQLLFFGVLDPKTNWDVMVMKLPDGTPMPFVSTPADERSARMSPAGRWIAYGSNANGPFEIYVQAFPGSGARWQVSRGGGSQVQWRRDGRELYYVAPDRKLMAVEVNPTGSTFTWGEARALMDTRMTGWERTGGGCCQYAPSHDGQRFLINTATNAAIPITVAVNWSAALRR